MKLKMTERGRGIIQLNYPSAFLKTDYLSDIIHSSVVSILCVEERTVSFQTIPRPK
jgi:hypothetical protein